MFKNKTLLITGGTGTFGNAVLGRFLKTEVREIRIFSRDEKKQEDMRLAYNDSKLKFMIGDVREYDSISAAMAGVDLVFHAAALMGDFFQRVDSPPHPEAETGLAGFLNRGHFHLRRKRRDILGGEGRRFFS